MLHEETSQPKASGISSEPGDLILMVNSTAKAFEPKYKKGTYMGGKSTWQPSGHPGLQRKHLYGTHDTHEEDYTDRLGC